MEHPETSLIPTKIESGGSCIQKSRFNVGLVKIDNVGVYFELLDIYFMLHLPTVPQQHLVYLTSVWAIATNPLCLLLTAALLINILWEIHDGTAEGSGCQVPSKYLQIL